ncbi:hypothetical protein HN018_25500 (plasmid) [Lichenicola cladoniae]|uniref:Uncharacterized protein n=1 Tax=Lichenicola cladoniae TaxID=1484109 RepID=A0A6M8HYU5_9PROT|nr:hypothetical protein [Lichenicola cladoniae]NPD66784.1 hypothetical protein [Acetobacteraceae bacterium]QKE93518.1 hypothetical protein HN018_25500 [Lichenicola cladoniae]
MWRGLSLASELIQMMQVLQQPDGRYAVRDIGGIALDDVLAVFDSRTEAEEWLLDHALQGDEAGDGLGVMKPGSGEAVR